jgi:hypothetical protein
MVQRIDPVTNEVTATISVGGPDSFVPDIAADGDELWATVWVDDGEWKLVHIDPATNSVAREIELPPTIGDHLVVTGGRAWLSGFEFPDPGVIDLATGEVIAHFDVGTRFFEGFGSVWANPQTGTGEILRIDPRTLAVTTVELADPEANLTAVSETGLWATGGGRGYKLSPEGELLLTVDATSIRAALGGDLYTPIGPREDRTDFILRIDERTGEVIERLDYPIDGWTEELSVAAGSIWAGNPVMPGLVRYEPGDRP